MKKNLFASILAIILTFSLTTTALAAGTWMPDPGPTLGADGYYLEDSVGNDGTVYEVYGYDVNMTLDEMSKFIVTYTEALKDMGFTAQRPSGVPAEVVYAMQYGMNGTVAAEMAVTAVDGPQTISRSSTYTWRVFFFVPTFMSFTLGSGAPGTIGRNTVCVGCHGSGRCMGCSGLGRMNYGAGYETCVVCHGSGICNICDGVGSY